MRDESQAFFFSRNPFNRKNVLEMADDARRRHVAQVELQTAGEHRNRHLLRISCRKNELYVFGRFLKRLQHGVEGGAGEHVHFVDHVDLEASDRRRIHCALKQRRHVLN